MLATDNLLLRPWPAADLTALFTEFSDPDIVPFSWRSPDPYTEADAQRYLLGRRRGEQLELAMVPPVVISLGAGGRHSSSLDTGQRPRFGGATFTLASSLSYS